ncbi:MAG: hypothetical protein JWO51_4916 [Rhodospirillales bacterium]|nr:hypothetical protein [Rhodospirillales bacterium]
MVDQTAMHRATEHFENAVKALRSATTHYQKASTGQPWPEIQAAMEEMITAQERYDKAEQMLRQLAAGLEAARHRRFV